MNKDHVFYSAVHPHEGQRKFVLGGLDGIRAIAVLLVLVYHFWPQVLPGGMIGVDVFFVISGYLITALLLREGAYTGKMDIVAFWVRRLRRLIPAVALLTLVVGTLSLLLGGDVQVGLGRQILGAFTYSSNWLLIWANKDYFTQTSPELMTNFWSLAVEEQFYFFWPVLLVFAFMFLRTWRQRALVPAALGVISLVLAAIMIAAGASATRVYYGTDTHLYGLMLGVLLAMLLPWSMYPPVDERLYPIVGYGKGAWGWLRQGIGWLSLFLILPLALNLSDTKPGVLMPWGLFAGALLGLGMIQALLPDVRGGSSGAFRALLSLAPLRWVGQRSYGIYLWHWPLMVLAHYLFGADRGAWVNVLVLVLTFCAAGASYVYVEQPVRHLGFRGALSAWLSAVFTRHRRVLPVAAAVGVSLALVATVFAVRTAPEMTEAQKVVAAGAAAQAKASGARGDGADSSGQPADSAAAVAPRVSVVGDSVTLAASAALLNSVPDAAIDA
ncbi:MAG: acyltransferase family protein, partial [Rothia sp. (in: high G+C Gram-positive bacteria)]|nr:acyltransferase family protein [Rothia sp. (in: high G+C Gram-positive bacteria)]